MSMIVTCPNCATRQPSLETAANKQACRSCGASWIEASAQEVITFEPGQPAVFIDPELEVARLTRAALARNEAAQAQAQRRKREVRALSVVAAAALILLTGLFALPDRIVALVPAMVNFYAHFGMEVNVRGLAFRDVKPQMLEADGTRVFAVRGQIENISGSERRIPAIRFALLAEGEEVYSWQLPATSRKLKPGESTGFLTRLAAPPEKAGELEIRFAHEGEIGSNDGP
jgi:hypothetical protein